MLHLQLILPMTGAIEHLSQLFAAFLVAHPGRVLHKLTLKRCRSLACTDATHVGHMVAHGCVPMLMPVRVIVALNVLDSLDELALVHQVALHL